MSRLAPRLEQTGSQTCENWFPDLSGLVPDMYGPVFPGIMCGTSSSLICRHVWTGSQQYSRFGSQQYSRFVGKHILSNDFSENGDTIISCSNLDQCCIMKLLFPVSFPPHPWASDRIITAITTITITTIHVKMEIVTSKRNVHISVFPG